MDKTNVPIAQVARPSGPVLRHSPFITGKVLFSLVSNTVKYVFGFRTTMCKKADGIFARVHHKGSEGTEKSFLRKDQQGT